MGRDALRLHREATGSGGDRGGDHRLLQEEARPLQMPEPGGVRRAAQDLDRQDPEVQTARDGENGVRLAASSPSCFLQHILETLARADGRMSSWVRRRSWRAALAR